MDEKIQISVSGLALDEIVWMRNETDQAVPLGNQLNLRFPQLNRIIAEYGNRE